MQIEYGNREGRWFTQWRFDELKALAEEIAKVVAISDVKIWYDAYHDYHRLDFRIGESTYQIRYYKVFAVSKNGNDTYEDGGTKNFGRSTWDLVRFFARGDYKAW